MNKEEQEITRKIRERILAGSDSSLAKVILFGSRADGTASSDSDFDVLVIRSGSFVEREERERLRRALGDLRFWVDLHIMPKADFEATRNIVGYLSHPAHHHGIIIYERSGRATDTASRTGVDAQSAG